MASSIKGLSDYDPKNIPNAEGLRFGICVSSYHDSITFSLRDGCIDTLLKHGAKEEDIIVDYVPGAFELTKGARMLAGQNKLDAVIILGCVIRGETDHDKYINQAVAQGITMLNIASPTHFIFGLLTPNTEEQAKDRSGGKHGNKGVEAAVTAILMASKGKSKPSSIGF